MNIEKQWLRVIIDSDRSIDKTTNLVGRLDFDEGKIAEVELTMMRAVVYALPIMHPSLNVRKARSNIAR